MPRIRIKRIQIRLKDCANSNLDKNSEIKLSDGTTNSEFITWLSLLELICCCGCFKFLLGTVRLRTTRFCRTTCCFTRVRGLNVADTRRGDATGRTGDVVDSPGELADRRDEVAERCGEVAVADRRVERADSPGEVAERRGEMADRREEMADCWGTLSEPRVKTADCRGEVADLWGAKP